MSIQDGTMSIQERIATSLELIAHLMLEEHKRKREATND